MNKKGKFNNELISRCGEQQTDRIAFYQLHKFNASQPFKQNKCKIPLQRFPSIGICSSIECNFSILIRILTSFVKFQKKREKRRFLHTPQWKSIQLNKCGSK